MPDFESDTQNSILFLYQLVQVILGRSLTYRHGLISDDDLEDLTELKTVVLVGPAISRDIVGAIHDNDLLGAGGEYGDPLVGDSLE